MDKAHETAVWDTLHQAAKGSASEGGNMCSEPSVTPTSCLEKGIPGQSLSEETELGIQEPQSSWTSQGRGLERELQWGNMETDEGPRDSSVHVQGNYKTWERTTWEDQRERQLRLTRGRE